MSFVLRDYQAETVRKSVEFLQSPSQDHGLIVVPTGGGKSLCIAETVLQLGAPALVFQPSKELLEQNHAKFCSYGYRPSIFSASAGKKRVGARITLATIGSVVNKPHLFTHVRYIIIDEAHAGLNAKNVNGQFMLFLRALQDVKILGYTATPYRLAHDSYGGSILKFLTRTRPRVFSKLVHVVQTRELFDRGFLCPLEYKEVKTGFRADRLRLNSTGADYTDESVKEHFRELNFDDQVVRCVNRLKELGRGSSLVFTRFVEQAKYVASQIPGAATVSAETKKNVRDSIVKSFKAGRIPCVVNVGIFGIGFDYPELANVILAAPTRSLARYYQWVGRVVRTAPGKTTAFAVDMCGLVQRFGRIEDLEIKCGPHETWFIESQGNPLTNVYFGAPPNVPDKFRKGHQSNFTEEPETHEEQTRFAQGLLA